MPKMTPGAPRQELKVDLLPVESADGKSIALEGPVAHVLTYLQRSYAGRLDAPVRVVLRNQAVAARRKPAPPDTGAAPVTAGQQSGPAPASGDA